VTKPAPEPFKLYAGHPGLELINTLDMRFTQEPVELLPTYRELLRFCAQVELLTQEQARRLAHSVQARDAQKVLSAAKELREALSAYVYGRIDRTRTLGEPLPILERHFHDAALHRTLQTDDARLGWTWSGVEHEPEFPLWRLAQESEDLLMSHAPEQTKECGDPSCRWLFLDTSKNHTRRWCDMKTCGNRMKARRFQAKSGERVVN
jgi:predicted RNA-binding Zn ribbon-like protein